VKELKGFQRISLQSGSTETVSFQITSDKLAFWNVEKQRVVESGDFLVMVGPNCQELQMTKLTVR
jgi:beta-glucosidase